MRGFIREFFPDRGFGFVACEDGLSRFCHVRDCVNGEPQVGDGVTFELVPDNRGRRERCAQVVITSR